MKLKFKLCTVVMLSVGFSAQAAEQAASNYPARPIRLLVQQAPGGSNDIMARYFGTKIAERTGHQVVVDNRPGAEGMIATDLVARSNPDGYTVLMTSIAFAMNPAMRKLPYDPIKDFDWAGLLGAGPYVIIVSPSAPVKTLQDLVALGRSKSNYITMASAGGGMHFVSAMFRTQAGFDAVIALYKGGAPALIDVMNGQAHLAIPALATAASHLRSGKLRALAVAAEKRSAAFPDVPTTVEAGMPDYRVAQWWAWGVRAGTPQSILNRLHAEITAVQKLPETQKHFAAEGAEILSLTPAEVRVMIAEDIARWIKVGRDAGIKPQ